VHKKILITGATGNIGREVIRCLTLGKVKEEVLAGVRNIARAQHLFTDCTLPHFVHFDFEDPRTFDKALEQVDRVFLLRPPNLANVERYFKPLIKRMKEKGIREVVFLSVQGAGKSPIIPHNKIERLIREHQIDHIFLRPGYFMQNLITNFQHDVQEKRKIILPAGRAKFNWVDGQDIGEAAAILLEQFGKYKNQALELTGYENADFYTVVDLINRIIEDPIEFDNANLLRFYRIRKREGFSTGLIMVMIMLHFLPRFQQEPQVSDVFEKLTGKRPTTLIEFIEREKHHFYSKYQEPITT